MDEDEMLELAMEQSLAETTNRRGGGGGGRSGGGRSQRLVERPRETISTTRSIAGSTSIPRRSISGRLTRRNSLDGNPMALHMPPPPDEASQAGQSQQQQQQQPDFIWKKGPNNRYYKCPISELNEEELQAAGIEASSRHHGLSERERLEQIEQDILEQAMEASIADARKRPGAVQVPPPSHLLNGIYTNPAGPANRRRCNTAPTTTQQHSTNQRPLSEDNDDYEDDEEEQAEPGKTQAEIEQEELLIRLAVERSLREASSKSGTSGGGDNVSRDGQGSVHTASRSSSIHRRPPRRDSMPTQHPDGNWGDRSPVRQEQQSVVSSTPRSFRRHSMVGGQGDSFDDRRHHSIARCNSDDSQYSTTYNSASCNGSAAFVWKKSKGGRYYKAPIDGTEEEEYDMDHESASPPAVGGETEAERLQRMEEHMLKVAMERSIMEN
jgi:hypothetical protein